jgi:serine protease Do
VTPELADALGLDAAKGALVADVTPSSPAAAAGLQAGDVIVSFGGKDVADMAALPKLVAALAPGASAEVAAIRGGDRVIVSVLIGDLGASQVAQAADAPAGPMKIEGLGVELASLDDATRAALGLDADARGVVIAAVDPEGAAASKLRAGDLVISVDGAAVNSPAEVRGLLASRDGAKAALLIVKRGGSDMFVGIRLKQA